MKKEGKKCISQFLLMHLEKQNIYNIEKHSTSWHHLSSLIYQVIFLNTTETNGTRSVEYVIW